jgi:hypothetical protein
LARCEHAQCQLGPGPIGLGTSTGVEEDLKLDRERGLGGLPWDASIGTVACSLVPPSQPPSAKYQSLNHRQPASSRAKPTGVAAGGTRRRSARSVSSAL